MILRLKRNTDPSATRGEKPEAGGISPSSCPIKLQIYIHVIKKTNQNQKKRLRAEKISKKDEYFIRK